MNKGNSDVSVIPLYGRLFSFNKKRNDDIGKDIKKVLSRKSHFWT